MFDQTNAALMRIIDYFQTYLKILLNPMLPGIDDISQTEKDFQRWRFLWKIMKKYFLCTNESYIIRP